MAISLSSIKKTTAVSAPRVLIVGGAGIGKTTWASQAPNPVFLFTEDGAGLLQVNAFPKLESFEQAMEAIAALYTEDHDYKTVVVDSIDHLEPLIWDKVCRAHNVESIEAIGYGKGYVDALNYWRQFLDGINALRDERGMAVILIGHVHVRRFESPEHDSIDRFEPKLHAKASALVQESVDTILFAKQKTVTKTENLGFGNTRTRGITTGERVVCTVETPAYVAKNRYNLPAELPLRWDAFADAINQQISNNSEAA